MNSEIQNYFELWPTKVSHGDCKKWAFEFDTTRTIDKSRVDARITSSKLRNILCCSSFPVEVYINNHELVSSFKRSIKVLDNTLLLGKKSESRALAAVMVLSILKEFFDKCIDLKRKYNWIDPLNNVKNFGMFEEGCYQYIRALQDCYLPFINDYSKMKSFKILCMENTSEACSIMLPEKIVEYYISDLIDLRRRWQENQEELSPFYLTLRLMKIAYCWFEDLSLYFETRIRFCSDYLKDPKLNDVLRFSLMTFNVYEHKCSSPVSAIDYIENSKCDIVCTQEDVAHDIKLKSYRSWKKCGLRKDGAKSHEIETVYFLKKEYNLPTYTLICIKENPELGKYGPYQAPIRSAIIFNYKCIKIANVHLDGGRYVHSLLETETEEVIIALMQFKMNLIVQVIRTDPDIILGDFNTVHIVNKEKKRRFLLEEQDKFFRYRYAHNHINTLTPAIIEEWNCNLEKMLDKKGYVYAEPSNANEFEYIVDGFWYKPKHIYKMETFIDDIIPKTIIQGNSACAFSDHNPVLARVYLRY